jgi:Lysylphosphatidylglycerol synthase TM region
VKLAITAGAVYFLFSSETLRLSSLRVTSAGWWWILLAGGLVLTQMLILQLRFLLLLNVLGADVRMGRTVRAGFISWFLNASLLGGFGFLTGDAVRAGYLVRDRGDYATVIAASLLDRAVGLAGLLTLCGVGLLVGLGADVRLVDVGVPSHITYGLAALCVLLPVLLAAMGLSTFVSNGYSPLTEGGAHKGERTVGSILRALTHALAHKKGATTLATTYLSALFTHSLVVLAILVLGHGIALEYAPSLGQVVFAAPLALMTAVLPLPANGLGVGEIAFDSLIRLFPSPALGPLAGGAALYLSYRIVATVMALTGLPFFLSSRAKAHTAVMRT